jgi:activator of 2-hydroxyglutaryl-CoA dehydratase
VKTVHNEVYIGIDVGSTTSSIAALGVDGTLIAHAYAFHQGKVADSVRSILARLFPSELEAKIYGTGRTSTSPHVELPFGNCIEVDNRVAEIEALSHFHPEVRTLLVVGAEKFARITFGPDGGYRRIRRNSSCAAGTGSFLDQQALRLGLVGGSADLAAKALANPGDFPAIASRCSVFAKTDLIHAQAEGWSVEAICDGLCQGLARNIADTLFPGELPDPPVFMAGGVSRNASVIKHLSTIARSEIKIDEVSQVYGAIGAALRVLATQTRDRRAYSLDDIRIARDDSREYANAPLANPTGDYPDFSSLRHFPYVARKNGPAVEVDLYLSPDELLRTASTNAATSDERTLPVLLGIGLAPVWWTPALR